MEFRDYYKILDIDADADAKTIKTAYRKLARKYHPDVSDVHDAENKFKEVTEAYEVLGDTKKRAEYDELRKYGQQGDHFQPPPNWQSSGGFEGGATQYEGDFSDFFENIFGGGRRNSQAGGFSTGRQGSRGRDIETELPIFLEDTLSDASQQISYHLPHYDDFGRTIKEVKKTLNVKIPRGVADGEKIRLKGQGAPGFGDAPSGDLYLRIRLVPHPLFDVEGRNLLITIPLLPWEAALGTKITVPTLDGKIQLTIVPNSQSGQRLRIKGKGLQGKTERGDLYAIINVVMPEKISPNDQSLWEELAKNNHSDPREEWRTAK